MIVIPISKLKHLKHRLGSNYPDAKRSAKYLGVHCHLKYFVLLIVVSSLYKISLMFPLIHIELLLHALLTALPVCFAGRGRTGNTILALLCVHRNS